MMPLPETVVTERLLLRVPLLADAEEMFARYAHDTEVTRYMSWTPHQSAAETTSYLERVIADRENGLTYSWLIYPRAGGALLGSIGCGVQETRLQFGYCLAHDSWGQGFATEAARAFLNVAFANPAIWRVQAYCDVENSASARVLTKAGMNLEGLLRRYMVFPNLGDAPRDVLFYAKVRE